MSSHKPARTRVWRVGLDKSRARPPTSHQVMSKAIWRFCQKLAAAFHRFCQLNPKPCPIIGISEAGNPRIPSLGIDLDIRTDLPRYRVWREGKLIEEPTDIVSHWRDDLVAFVIGCSFSLEHALMADGLIIRHIEQGCNVPMYRTNVPCAPAGPFAGPLVVSMRPFNPADGIRAIQITTRFPAVHGAPVHFGDPAQSASATSRSRTTATRCPFGPTKSRYFGRAARHRNRSFCNRGLILPLPTHQAACSSPTGVSRNLQFSELRRMEKLERLHGANK